MRIVKALQTRTFKNFETLLSLRRSMTIFLNNGNLEEKAILLSTSSEDASAWEHATPISSLDLKLENSAFKIVYGLRIGAKICVPYKCVCGTAVDEFGGHALHCKKAAGRSKRHAEGNRIFK